MPPYRFVYMVPCVLRRHMLLLSAHPEHGHPADLFPGQDLDPGLLQDHDQGPAHGLNPDLPLVRGRVHDHPPDLGLADQGPGLGLVRDLISPSLDLARDPAHHQILAPSSRTKLTLFSSPRT